MSFSEFVWSRIKPIYQALLEHPFNQKLMNGNLEQEKFIYFLEQDCLYLNHFAECQEKIAAQVPEKYVSPFMHFRDLSYLAKENIEQQYFQKHCKLLEPGPATLSYIHHLKRICSEETCAVAVAAVLPCFWLFQEAGCYIFNHSGVDNPYASWIEHYVSPDYVKTTEDAIEIFDEMAKNVSDEVKEKMSDAFYQSSLHEWYFCNDAYEMRSFYTA